VAGKRPDRKIDRIVDANANRAGEGLRAVEDVLRFVFDRSALTLAARKIRHELARRVSRMSSRRDLLAARDSGRDVGAGRWRAGMRRTGLPDLVTANMRRAQESVRVLEEISRMKADAGASRGLQALRFRLYALEKRAFGEISRARRRCGRKGRCGG